MINKIKKRGFNNTITLIDSLYSDRVKIKNVKVKLDDD